MTITTNGKNGLIKYLLLRQPRQVLVKYKPASGLWLIWGKLGELFLVVSSW
jgi:hypothetical protein